MDEMRVYIVNLGKYVEGKDTGAWFQCPVDYEKVKETLELDSEHGEYAIHDYELPFEIDEYIGIGELNRLCRMVEEFEEPVKKALKELIECCGDLESLYEKKDDIIYYFGCESASDVAYYFVNECGYFGEVADNVKMYIDYEALGRDLELNREIYDTGKGIFGIPS